MHEEKKKIHEILRKSRFRVETITFIRFFRAAYLRRGPRTTFAGERMFYGSNESMSHNQVMSQ